MPGQLDFANPYYPYEKVQTGYSTFRGWEDIPYKIIMYLLDLPDANGYIPIDDNSRPRVRLAKYLWYDGARPLDKALPTPAQKLSMLFDPENPDINTDEDKQKHPQGYRLFAQNNIGQSQLDAQTIIYCYIGRDTPYSGFETRTAIEFDIWTNNNFETNTKTTHYTRIDAIEQAIKESLNGVNITGVGTILYDRRFHGECGSYPIYDEATDTGRKLVLALAWMESGGNDGRLY